MAVADAYEVAFADLAASQARKIPRDPEVVAAHNRILRDVVIAMPRPKRLDPSVIAFEKMLQDNSPIRMLVNQMIDQVPKRYRTVDSVEELLLQLNQIVKTAPKWNVDKNKRNAFPMSMLFTHMMITEAGYAVFRMGPMNDALRGVLKSWCDYLDYPGSAHGVTDSPEGWFQGYTLPRNSEAFRKSAWHYNALDSYQVDMNQRHGGFECFNAFFHREIKPEVRPIDGADDPRVVVSPNDGTIYHIAREVALETTFWIKSQPYSLHDMLNGHDLTQSYPGGDVLQSYLQGSDYHRWHAPVSGKVVKLEVVPALMFSNLESEGNDISGVGSQGYYTSVNTRGLCFIEADHKPLGVVCVMPVGITEISSIRHTVKVGDHVTKGQEIGRFSYGGSSLATIFQPGAINHFTAMVPDNPAVDGTLQVNAEMAIAN